MNDMVKKGRSTKGRKFPGRKSVNWRLRHPESILRGEMVANAKLTTGQVISMRLRHNNGEITVKELAAEYGLHPGYIRLVLARKRWRHIE